MPEKGLISQEMRENEKGREGEGEGDREKGE